MKKWKKGSRIRWNHPSMITAAILFAIILAVPALIVAPFKVDDTAKGQGNETKAEPVTLEESDSAFSVEVLRSQTKEVESMPLETYVMRVVASEMPAEFELEALKAQALAARTYIVNHMTHAGEDSLPKGTDVSDTVDYQVYKNDSELRSLWGSDYKRKMEKIKTAVAETKGEIVTYEEAPITPAFFSTSNGYTENSEDYWENELPYLRSVKSPWDESSPKYLDQEVFAMSKVEDTLGVDIPSSTEEVAKISRTESNRVEDVKIGGKTFTGREIREQLELQSSDFNIEQKNNHLIFTTKGFGHGIGMSQYGANGMAQEGNNYKDIVQHYYQGTKVNKINSATPKLAAK